MLMLCSHHSPIGSPPVAEAWGLKTAARLLQYSSDPGIHPTPESRLYLTLPGKYSFFPGWIYSWTRSVPESKSVNLWYLWNPLILMAIRLDSTTARCWCVFQNSNQIQYCWFIALSLSIGGVFPSKLKCFHLAKERVVIGCQHSHQGWRVNLLTGSVSTNANMSKISHTSVRETPASWIKYLRHLR